MKRTGQSANSSGTKPSHLSRFFSCLWPTLSAVLTFAGCSPSGPPTHGTAFVLQIETNRPNQTVTPQSSREVEDVLRARLAKLGVRPFFESSSEGRLSIKVGAIKPETLVTIRQMLTNSALLEFRIVHPDSHQLLAQELIEPGYQVLLEAPSQKAGETSPRRLLVKREAERGLNGTYIKRAMVMKNAMTGEPEIQFEFNAEGSRRFESITTEYKPKGRTYYQLAMVLNGQVMSAPRIVGPISGGRGLLSGDFTAPEAESLATALDAPLPFHCRMVDERNF